MSHRVLAHAQFGQGMGGPSFGGVRTSSAHPRRMRFAMSHNAFDPSFGIIYQRNPEQRMRPHGHFVGAPGVDVLGD